ncbi:MAG: DUF3466 family protein [Proteobacteria bacterium]|nr:DUF3466 family protein [Pseudomonadota bacterium]
MIRARYLAITAGILSASISMSANADWSIAGLGTLGGERSDALSINNTGQMVGSYYSYNNPSSVSAFILNTANGAGMTDLLGGYGMATGINDSGQVTGQISNHAFITGANATGITNLGDLGGINPSMYPSGYSVGSAINNFGQVAGYSYIDSNFVTHAFITGPNGGMTDLGTLVDGYYSSKTQSYATDINDSGQVVGYSDVFLPMAMSALHAFITGPNGVGMIDLGTLGGLYSYAYGINNSGQVVGLSQTATCDDYIAFITDANGTNMTSLGTLGGARSWATDINDSGQVVGVSDTANGLAHGFLYSDGVMIDLLQLAPVVAAGWSALAPEAINDLGQIVGTGVHNGTAQAFLLSPFDIPAFPVIEPIPSPILEPQTYAMLLAGLGLIGFSMKRSAISARLYA